MKTVLSVIPLFFLLCSCYNEKELPESDLSVGLYVEVGGQSLSRTVTGTDGSVTFADGDRVGLFSEGLENPVLWTFADSRWSNADNVKWQNRTDDFEFLAYYPCINMSGVTRHFVPMPDLSEQSGDIADIGEKDFLVGRCISSYSDNDGVVSFSGDNSFSHVCSLLYLNIVSDDPESEVTLSECEFSGEGIVTPHVYSFESSSMEKSDSEEASVLQIKDLSSLSSIAVIINPVSLETPLRFTLVYFRDGSKYEASASLGKDFPAATFSKVTLRIVNGSLVMTGNEVRDWNIVTLDDIVLIGSSM